MFIPRRNVKDIQRTSSGRLSGGRLGGVVRYMITINNILSESVKLNTISLADHIRT